MPIASSLSTFFHRFLRIPYKLNVQVFQAPKKPKDTYVLIHGIGNTLHSWDGLVAKMPKDVQIIGIDLLGFGKSPKPSWAVYSARTQARSVAMTIINLGLKQRPILIGHSLGALVAVEFAKRYPLFIKELILCSPPFYEPEADKTKRIPSQEALLRQLYRQVKRYPEQLEKLSPLAVKLGLANSALSISKDTIPSYLAALEASIINQTSLNDIRRLRHPIMIFYGSFDAVVVGKHIVHLSKTMKNVRVKRLLAGHEVMGGYEDAVANYIKS